MQICTICSQLLLNFQRRSRWIFHPRQILLPSNILLPHYKVRIKKLIGHILYESLSIRNDCTYDNYRYIVELFFVNTPRGLDALTLLIIHRAHKRDSYQTLVQLQF